MEAGREPLGEQAPILSAEDGRATGRGWRNKNKLPGCLPTCQNAPLFLGSLPKAKVTSPAHCDSGLPAWARPPLTWRRSVQTMTQDLWSPPGSSIFGKRGGVAVPGLQDPRNPGSPKSPVLQASLLHSPAVEGKPRESELSIRCTGL